MSSQFEGGKTRVQTKSCKCFVVMIRHLKRILHQSHPRPSFPLQLLRQVLILIQGQTEPTCLRLHPQIQGSCLL